MQFTLTQEEYEALIALARVGAEGDPGKTTRLDTFLRNIEKKNGVTRDALWVQWQEADQPLPPTTRFPDVWPPNMRYYLELISRKITQADVLSVLTAQASNPVNVLVTVDPAAIVGWTKLEDFF